jgi:hypothetical protein
MTSPTRSIVDGTILWVPEADLELAAEASAPAIEFALLVPRDLTQSHGVDITLARLEEMQRAYDPTIEAASLNFDHAWGGPSLGWCERVWIKDGALWVRYVDLADAAVEGIRTKQYVRRSAEFVLAHPVTGGWYLTGTALLGNARPAIPALPPITLCRPQYVLAAARKEPPMPDPANPPTPPPVSDPTAELSMLRAQVAEGEQALLTILRHRAELQVEQRLAALGSRVTPAVAKLARPLLIELLAVKVPVTVQLQDDPAKPAAAVGIADRIFEMLAASPPIEALGAGELAATEAPRAAALPQERLAELNEKYNFQTKSFGYRRLN